MLKSQLIKLTRNKTENYILTERNIMKSVIKNNINNFIIVPFSLSNFKINHRNKQ